MSLLTKMKDTKKTLSLKKSFIICIAQIFLSAILFTLFKKACYSNVIQANEDLHATQEPSERERIILLWTWPWTETFPLNVCPPYFNIKGCFYTMNRTLFSSADAVVIHHRNSCYSKNQLPPMIRPPNQYWVWFNMESLTYSPNLHFMDNLINITMSYRTDSDIFSPYGWLEKNKGDENFTIPTKTKLVAWAISHWVSNSRRVLYYNELKKYLSVDIYGSHHKSLPKQIHDQILSKYKFYLAFENSVHEDYITEKLWNTALSNGIVPIVLGPSRENYERFIPKESFIHVDDFPTAQGLAEYILKLDRDDKAYQQYFNWRSRLHPIGRIPWQTTYSYCRVCRALKEAPGYKTIARLGDWYK